MKSSLWNQTYLLRVISTAVWLYFCTALNLVLALLASEQLTTNYTETQPSIHIYSNAETVVYVTSSCPFWPERARARTWGKHILLLSSMWGRLQLSLRFEISTHFPLYFRYWEKWINTAVCFKEMLLAWKMHRYLTKICKKCISVWLYYLIRSQKK